MAPNWCSISSFANHSSHGSQRDLWEVISQTTLLLASNSASLLLLGIKSTQHALASGNLRGLPLRPHGLLHTLSFPLFLTHWPLFPLTSAEVLPLTTLSSPLCSKTAVALPYYIAHRVTVITCLYICPFIYCLFPSLHPQNRASFGFLAYSSVPRPPNRDGSQSIFVEWPCEPPF